ncbi:armadillo-type protein [Mycena olivaceomarginata]|nr:armadillo-type protein [Mycena olivaceomarginata]
MRTIEATPKLISLLGDPDPDLQEAALKVLLELARHGRSANRKSFTLERTIVLMFDDPPEEIQAANAVAYFLSEVKGFLEQNTEISNKAAEPNMLTSDLNRMIEADATPVVWKKLLSMLERPESYTRQAALEAIVAISKHTSARQVFPLEDELAKVLALLRDKESGVRWMAMDFVNVFLDNGSNIGNITQEITSKVMLMLGDSDWAVRQRTLETIFALDKHGKSGNHALHCTNELITSPEDSQKIFSMLYDADEDVRAAALKVISKLYPAITEGHSKELPLTVVQQIVTMLADGYGKKVIPDAMTALARHDNFFASMITPKSLRTALYSLMDDQERVRTHIVDAVVRLVATSYGRDHGADLVISTMKMIITTLGASRNLKEGFVQVITGAMNHSSLEKIRSDIVATIGEMLVDQVGVWSVRLGALDAVIALGEDAQLQTSIATTNMVERILSRLEDPNLNIREQALQSIVTLTKYDDAMKLASTEQTMHTVSALLNDGDLNVREEALKCLCSLLKYGQVSLGPWKHQLSGFPEHFRALALTPNWIAHLVEMLQGREGDSEILQLIDNLLDQRTSFSFSSDDADQLVILLRNQNITVSQSAISIIQHFATNAQFRQDVLKTDVWAVLLRHQETAVMVPKILAQFTESGELDVWYSRSIIDTAGDEQGKSASILRQE